MVFLPPLWGPAREPGPPRREESRRQTPGRGLSLCHSAAELWAGKCPEPWAGPSPGPEVPPPPLPLPRPGPRSSRRPLGLEGRGGPRPPTPVQGRPRPPPDPAPPGVPPTRPAACLRHRPAGWIWFQPSLAGLTCAVRGGCGGREVPRSRAHLAAWDAEVSAPGRERAVGAGGRGGPSCRAGRGLGGALETRNRGGGGEEEGPGPPSPASRREGPERLAFRARDRLRGAGALRHDSTRRAFLSPVEALGARRPWAASSIPGPTPVPWALPAPPSLCKNGEWSGPRRCPLPQAGLSSPLATRLRGLYSRRP